MGARCDAAETRICAVVSGPKRPARRPPRRSGPAVRTNSKDNASAGGAGTRALAICAAANRGGGEKTKGRLSPRNGGKKNRARKAGGKAVWKRRGQVHGGRKFSR